MRTDTCKGCGRPFTVTNRGRSPNLGPCCRQPERRVGRPKTFSPSFGPRCTCGHLAFIHRDGIGKCIVDRCDCKRATVTDTRWSSRRTLADSTLRAALVAPERNHAVRGK